MCGFFEEHGDEYTEDDYLIICGHVGVCGFNPDIEKETRQILRELPVTVLFIDGNHEHHERLNDYPVDEWMGGKVHFIEPEIIHPIGVASEKQWNHEALEYVYVLNTTQRRQSRNLLE